MSQPVKLSDELVLDARLVSELSERSIASQIEFWARLGRALEPLLSGEKVLALKGRGDQKALSSLVKGINKPEGQRRLAEYLGRQPYPHYEPAPHQPGFLVRIDESGTRTVGKFFNRQFLPFEKSHGAIKSKSSTSTKQTKKGNRNK
jgi:hypothetical protein